MCVINSRARYLRTYTRQIFLGSGRMESLQSNIKDWLFLAVVTYVLKAPMGKKPVLNT